MRLFTAMLLSFLALGCESYPGLVQVQPATIPHIDDAGRAEIARAIVIFQGGNAPLLAKNVFQETDQLIIEPVQHRDANGLIIIGHEQRPPQSFRLQKRNQNCGLYDPKRELFTPLMLVNCVSKTQ